MTTSQKIPNTQLPNDQLDYENILKNKYKELLEANETTIVEMAINPEKIVKNFITQDLASAETLESARDLIRQFTLRKHKNEIVFKVLCFTTYKDVDKIKKSMRDSKNEGLENMFNIVGTKLQESVDKDVMVHVPVDKPETHEDSGNTTAPGQEDIVSIPSTEQRLEKQDILSFLNKAAKLGNHRAIADRGMGEVRTALTEVIKTREKKYDPERENDVENGAVKQPIKQREELVCKTPLHYAALAENSKNGMKCVEALLTVFKSQDSTDALATDVQSNIDTLKLLNIPDGSGNTVLHIAAERELTQFVIYLCKEGADILIKRNDGVTPLEIMYEKTPEAVFDLLNGTLQTDTQNFNDGNLNVRIDCRMIICPEKDSHSRIIPPKSEMELLATLAFGNQTNSLKTILRHVVIKSFLDLKWEKFRTTTFCCTAFYVIVHLFFTYFVIQVFIAQYPYIAENATILNVTTADENQSEDKLTFFTYINGNWKAAPAKVLIDDKNPMSEMLFGQGIALLVVAGILLLIEIAELCVILNNSSYKRHTKLNHHHVLLSVFLIAVAFRGENMGAILGGLLLLLLHFYHRINSGNMTLKTIKPTKQDGTKVSEKYSKEKPEKRPKQEYELPEIRKLLTGGNTNNLAQENANNLTQENANNSTQENANNLTQENANNLAQENAKHLTEEHAKTPTECCAKTKEYLFVFVLFVVYIVVIVWSFCHKDIVTGVIAIVNLVLFSVTLLEWNRHMFNFLAYLADLENILQLIFIGLMTYVAWVVNLKEITSLHYLCASISVMLSWTLILMQIGNIYGIGVYVQIFKRVLRRLVYVMCTYSVMLIAFAIAFTIIFPEKKLFSTLPASFFRVVAMMVGELNFDDVFDGNDDKNNLPAFPYAAQWMYTGFIVTIAIVLINLLTGLTISDIKKILNDSDVIHRSNQIEKLYIMERLYLCLPKRFRGNIDVISQEERKNKTLELEVGIKELPKALHNEIRLLAENPDEYSKEYLIDRIKVSWNERYYT